MIDYNNKGMDMNILEAIEAAKNGTVICYKSKRNCTYYIIQTTLWPLGLKQLKQVDTDEMRSEDIYPEKLSDLVLEDLDSVCSDAIFCESFTSISLDDMLSEIQQAWKKFNEEDDE